MGRDPVRAESSYCSRHGPTSDSASGTGRISALSRRPITPASRLLHDLAALHHQPHVRPAGRSAPGRPAGRRGRRSRRRRRPRPGCRPGPSSPPPPPRRWWPSAGSPPAHAQLVQEQELLAVGPVRPDAAVGAERDPHARLDREPDAGAVVLVDRPALVGRPGRHAPLLRMAGDPQRRHQRGHQRPIAIEHHLDRVAVQPDAVLDRADAGPQRVLDARRWPVRGP